ncbi:MAG: FecR domain-containing protein [Spirochaetales bacterium]|nr:FecR domain-containing protein [Spirochaetales bacterium]
MQDKWLDNITDDELSRLFQTPQENIAPELKKRIISQIARQKKSSQTFFTPLTLAAAATFLVLVPLLIFNFLGFFLPVPQNHIAYLNGDVYLERSGKKVFADINSILEQGDHIITPFNGEAAINFVNAYFVSIYPGSDLILPALRQNASIVTLKKGALLSSSLNAGNYAYQIRTPHALISPIGTRFYVSCDTRKSYIHVEQGKLKIQEIGNNVVSYLSANESLVISIEGQSQRNIIREGLASLYKQQEFLLQSKNKKQKLWLKIEAEPGDITLFINDWEFILHSKLSIKLEPGKYELAFHKAGYQSQSLTIDLETQDTPPVIVNLEAEPNNIIWSGIGLDSPIKPSEKHWQHQLIYQDTGSKASGSGILGFALSPEYFAAITSSSLICFSKNGKLLWTKNYPPEREVLFKGLPLIHEKQLLASTFDKVIAIDIESGAEKIVFSPGLLLEGQKPVLSQKKILFAFAAGIYNFDSGKMCFDFNPFIPFENSTTPLVTNTTLIAASSLSPELCAFDLNGKKQKCGYLGEYFYSSPVKMGEHIYLADNKAMLYQLTADLATINSMELEGRIYSLVPGNQGYLFALSDTGTLFNVNTVEQKIEWQIPIDQSTSPQSHVYSYKKPLPVNNEIMIGTNSGEIVAINAEQGEKTLCDNASGSPITTTLYPYYDFCLVGSSSGEIIKLEYR